MQSRSEAAKIHIGAKACPDSQETEVGACKTWPAKDSYNRTPACGAVKNRVHLWDVEAIGVGESIGVCRQKRSGWENGEFCHFLVAPESERKLQKGIHPVLRVRAAEVEHVDRP